MFTNETRAQKCPTGYELIETQGMMSTRRAAHRARYWYFFTSSDSGRRYLEATAQRNQPKKIHITSKL